MSNFYFSLYDDKYLGLYITSDSVALIKLSIIRHLGLDLEKPLIIPVQNGCAMIPKTNEDILDFISIDPNDRDMTYLTHNDFFKNTNGEICYTGGSFCFTLEADDIYLYIKNDDADLILMKDSGLNTTLLSKFIENEPSEGSIQKGGGLGDSDESDKGVEGGFGESVLGDNTSNTSESDDSSNASDDVLSDVLSDDYGFDGVPLEGEESETVDEQDLEFIEQLEAEIGTGPSDGQVFINALRKMVIASAGSSAVIDDGRLESRMELLNSLLLYQSKPVLPSWLIPISNDKSVDTTMTVPPEADGGGSSGSPGVASGELGDAAILAPSTLDMTDTEKTLLVNKLRQLSRGVGGHSYHDDLYNMHSVIQADSDEGTSTIPLESHVNEGFPIYIPTKMGQTAVVEGQCDSSTYRMVMSQMPRKSLHSRVLQGALHDINLLKTEQQRQREKKSKKPGYSLISAMRGTGIIGAECREVHPAEEIAISGYVKLPVSLGRKSAVLREHFSMKQTTVSASVIPDELSDDYSQELGKYAVNSRLTYKSLIPSAELVARNAAKVFNNYHDALQYFHLHGLSKKDITHEAVRMLKYQSGVSDYDIVKIQSIFRQIRQASTQKRKGKRLIFGDDLDASLGLYNRQGYPYTYLNTDGDSDQMRLNWIANTPDGGQYLMVKLQERQLKSHAGAANKVKINSKIQFLESKLQLINQELLESKLQLINQELLDKMDGNTPPDKKQYYLTKQSLLFHNDEMYAWHNDFGYITWSIHQLVNLKDNLISIIDNLKLQISVSSRLSTRQGLLTSKKQALSNTIKNNRVVKGLDIVKKSYAKDATQLLTYLKSLDTSDIDQSIAYINIIDGPLVVLNDHSYVISETGEEICCEHTVWILKNPGATEEDLTNRFGSVGDDSTRCKHCNAELTGDHDQVKFEGGQLVIRDVLQELEIEYESYIDYFIQRVALKIAREMGSTALSDRELEIIVLSSKEYLDSLNMGMDPYKHYLTVTEMCNTTDRQKVEHIFKTNKLGGADLFIGKQIMLTTSSGNSKKQHIFQISKNKLNNLIKAMGFALVMYDLSSVIGANTLVQMELNHDFYRKSADLSPQIAMTINLQFMQWYHETIDYICKKQQEATSFEPEMCQINDFSLTKYQSEVRTANDFYHVRDDQFTEQWVMESLIKLSKYKRPSNPLQGDPESESEGIESLISKLRENLKINKFNADYAKVATVVDVRSFNFEGIEQVVPNRLFGFAYTDSGTHTYLHETAVKKQSDMDVKLPVIYTDLPEGKPSSDDGGAVGGESYRKQTDDERVQKMTLATYEAYAKRRTDDKSEECFVSPAIMYHGLKYMGKAGVLTQWFDKSISVDKALRELRGKGVSQLFEQYQDDYTDEIVQAQHQFEQMRDEQIKRTADRYHKYEHNYRKVFGSTIAPNEKYSVDRTYGIKNLEQFNDVDHQEMIVKKGVTKKFVETGLSEEQIKIARYLHGNSDEIITKFTDHFNQKLSLRRASARRKELKEITDNDMKNIGMLTTDLYDGIYRMPDVKSIVESFELSLDVIEEDEFQKTARCSRNSFVTRNYETDIDSLNHFKDFYFTLMTCIKLCYTYSSLSTDDEGSGMSARAEMLQNFMSKGTPIVKFLKQFLDQLSTKSMDNTPYLNKWNLYPSFSYIFDITPEYFNKYIKQPGVNSSINTLYNTAFALEILLIKYKILHHIDGVMQPYKVVSVKSSNSSLDEVSIIEIMAMPKEMVNQSTWLFHRFINDYLNYMESTPGPIRDPLNIHYFDMIKNIEYGRLQAQAKKSKLDWSLRQAGLNIEDLDGDDANDGADGADGADEDDGDGGVGTVPLLGAELGAEDELDAADDGEDIGDGVNEGNL